MVSVMITSITMTMDRMAANWNVGMPKWNGVETANQAPRRSRLKLAMPSGQAIRVPSGQPDQDGDAAEEAGQEPVDEQDEQEGQPGQADVGRGAEVVGAGPAGRPTHGHREQRDADHGDDRAGDHRREEVDEPVEHRREQEADDPGDQDRTEDRREAGGAAARGLPMASIEATAANEVPCTSGSFAPIRQIPGSATGWRARTRAVRR